MSTRRDRHGRGLRGALMPASMPASGTRAEQFDDLVLDAFERLLPRWGSRLVTVEVMVQEVPDEPAARPDPAADPVVLARCEPATPGRAARIVVHRRPVLLRAPGHEAQVHLLEDLMVEQVADLLGLPAEEVDPGYGDDGPPR